MEKNEFYVEFADETPANYGRGTTPGICYLAYSQRGYYLTPRRQDAQYFASKKDAKEACLHLVPTSGALKDPFSAVAVRKGENTVCHVTKFRALPGGKECPTPRTLADTRKQLAAPFYVVVKHEGTEYHLSYAKEGYFAATCTPRANFETVEDAKRALAMVGKGSVALVSRNLIVGGGPYAVPWEWAATALPHIARALTPEEIANERKFAAGPNRPADFASHEKEHESMKLPEMEQSLISEFKARCEMGFKQYGPVYLAKRNWGKEMKEEALDGLFYALMAAKTVEKYGAFIQALEEASDDDLSMDACSPDPLKQAAYLVKKYAADLSAMESRDTHLQNSEALMKELADYRQEASMNMTRANALKAELDRRLQERDNYRESCEKLRKENLDMRAAMEAALSLGSPRG